MKNMNVLVVKLKMNEKQFVWSWPLKHVNNFPGEVFSSPFFTII